MNGEYRNGVPESQIDTSKYVASNIITKYTISMALKAAVELGIPDILAKAEGGKPLTAEEILAQLPVRSRKPDSDLARRLACVLEPLVWEGMFEVSFVDGNKQPAYGLTKVSQWLVKENELNMLPLVDHCFRQDLMNSYGSVSKSILDDDVNALEDCLGMPAYEYAGKHPDFSRAFQSLMSSFSNIEASTILSDLQRSGVLEGVQTLVDVGGGTGSNVSQIIAKNPQIKGFNYDLPHVIAQAPVLKGVTHISGNMFESVPSADAMYVKWIVHNYDDKKALTVLKNCCKALPKHGKAIIVEYVLTVDNERDPKSRVGVFADMHMLVFMTGARERTKAHYEKLIRAAGFSRTEFIQNPGSIDLIIAFK